MKRQPPMKAFERGYVMFEPTKFTYIFKFLGNTYTTNLKRTKEYSLDYPTWREANTQGYFYKLSMIFTNKVRKI